MRAMMAAAVLAIAVSASADPITNQETVEIVGPAYAAEISYDGIFVPATESHPAYTFYGYETRAYLSAHQQVQTSTFQTAQVQAVPEQATGILVASGMAWAVRRRRRK